MEENTDYTELETTEEHAEEIGTENIEESGTQDAESAEDFPADAELVENSPVDSETEDSGNAIHRFSMILRVLMHISIPHLFVFF